MKACILAAVLLAGCTVPESQIVGHWRGDAKLTEQERQMPLSNLKTGFAASMSLDVKPDHTFEMVALVVPIEGTWSLSGNRVTFTQKKVFGYKTGEGSTAKGSVNGGNPFTLALSPDGQRLESTNPKDDENGFSFVKEDVGS